MGQCKCVVASPTIYIQFTLQPSGGILFRFSLFSLFSLFVQDPLVQDFAVNHILIVIYYVEVNKTLIALGAKRHITHCMTASG